MFDPQRLRDPQAQLVAASEQSELCEIEAVGAGLELATGEIRPAATGGEGGAPAPAEIVSCLAVEEQGSRPAAAEHIAHAPAEQRLLLVQPAEADLQPGG